MFSYFYHQRIRKSVAIFGTLFNNIYVIRQGATRSYSQVKVPLSYAPSRKYLDRIRENPTLIDDTNVAIKLPRMAFEITSIDYDAGRQLPKNNNFQTVSTGGSLRENFTSAVPYNIGFQLSIFAKTQDDALQVVEQILPYFNPQYTLTVKPFDDHTDIKEDVPISLVGVDFADDYEGALEQRRIITYTLSFQMYINFYGPINNRGVIRTSITNVFDQNAGLSDSDLLMETLTTTPDPSGVIGLADSDFGFNTVITYP